MKQKVFIFRNGEEIFKGKALNLPIKEEYLIKKSIELFDDEDPCIIHQSYVVKEFVNEFLELFKSDVEINGKNYANKLLFLDFKKIEELVFKISRWWHGSLLRQQCNY